MTISSIYLSSCPPCSSAAAFHGGPLPSRRTSTTTTRRHNHVTRKRRSFDRELRPGGGAVSCSSASPATSEIAHEDNTIPHGSLIEALETSEPITFVHDIFRTRNATSDRQNTTKPSHDNADRSPHELLLTNHADLAFEEPAPSQNGRSISTTVKTAPLAAVSANALFTIESTPVRDRVEDFRKLNWKGKAAVLAALACAAVAVVLVGKKLATGVQGAQKSVAGAVGGEDEGAGDGDSSSPYSVIAKGFSTVQANLGPWSFQDLTLGLAAISKVTEKAPPKPPGQPAEELAKNASFLARAQHWRAMAEAAYTFDPASFSLQSQLPESCIVAAEWSPNQESLRPAYVVCIDAPYGAVVLSVRGTSQVVDMLVNSGASADPFLDGQGHGGFAHATDKLLGEAVPHIKRAFEAHAGAQRGLKLVVVGHSMGAAVGAMAALRLKAEFPTVECWGYSTPACVTLGTARACKDFVTSVVAHHDVVPRFSIAAVELLRRRICGFDWDAAERVAGGDGDWARIKSAADNLRSAEAKQREVTESVQQAGEGVGEKVQDVHEKMGSPLCDDNNKAETKEEMKEEKEHPPLYPPGRLLVLAADPPGCGKLPEDRNNVPKQRSSGAYPTFDEAKKVTWALHEVNQEDLKEIVVSPWCISDHMLGNLGEGLGYLQRHCEPAFGGPSPV